MRKPPADTALASAAWHSASLSSGRLRALLRACWFLPTITVVARDW